MSWYWYVFFFLLFFIILTLLSNARINILLNREQGNDFLQIKVSLFYNLIHYRKKIPLIKVESFNEGIKFKSETDTVGIKKDKKDRITPKKAEKWEKDYKKILKNINNFHPIIRRFLKRVYIDSFKWESIFGTGEAMNTGILAGLIWSIKGITLGLLGNYMILNSKPVINVTPIFDKKLFRSRLECIIRFRVGYVILTGIHLLFKLYQGGGKIGRRTSYSGINENSYGKS